MSKIEAMEVSMLQEQNKNLQYLVNVQKKEIAEEIDRSNRLNEELNRRILCRNNAVKKVCLCVFCVFVSIFL
jgi:hypothetical protein